MTNVDLIPNLQPDLSGALFWDCDGRNVYFDDLCGSQSQKKRERRAEIAAQIQ